MADRSALGLGCGSSISPKGVMLHVLTVPEVITLATDAFPRLLGSGAFRTSPQFDGVAPREGLGERFRPPLNRLVGPTVRLVFRPYAQIL